MPYIPEERREELAAGASPETAGELNYIITDLLNHYTDAHGGDAYPNFNDCLGALEGAKLEFYRRRVVPYEGKKCHENGDVYP
jgi:hypothetical protein